MMYGELEKGDLVWFDPSIGYTLPGEVIEYHKAAQVLTVQAVIGGKPQVFTLTSLNGVRKRQDLGQNGIDDMIQLSDLNEASLLWNLKIRYDKELIYTYVGSILVAVNPYKMFDIYGLDMVKKYENQILGTLPPHLFAIGSSAYSALNKTGDSQVVVISGESGAGKTESTKLVMQYLAAVNKSPSNLVTEQILEASPLLESFGNAKTVRNDNSSRFGKYLEVHFKEGIIIGAKVTEYLLEKSRIVTQAPEERNYHVFYEMLLGLSETQKQSYGLLTPEKYFYLNQGGGCEIDGKMDREDFQSLLSAMQVLGFTNDEQDTIFRILASVLHLGNVYFHRKQLRHGQEGVEIGSDAEIKWTAHLLKLNPDGIRDALMSKTTEARGERVQTPLSIDQSLDARDAFAKALYHTLFSWLVARINQIVYKGTKRTAAISILDIFGFEDFQENSFEQLCINYANENLQFYFNKQIFKLEQMEYVKEKIQWQTISYTDNVPIINLIAKKPVGIMHLLDDESNFPKATDVSFLEKCHYNHALDELYSRPRMSSSEFGLKHYAGQVWYNVDGFLDKNRDTLRSDVVELLISSKIKLISSMFENFRNNYESTKTINKANGRFVTMKPRTPTVAARFHDSLQQLLGLMDKCNPWFVRCIKPNNEKAPMKFDMPIVVEQLRYTGMLETIRIRKTGYPIRLKFSQFFDHFRYLLPDRGTSVARGTPYRELCRYIMEVKGCNSDDYQLGTTRIFLRENLERQLEKERSEILHKAALTLQTNIRGYLARRKYQNVKRSAVKLQAAFRGWSARKRYKIIRKGVISTQAKFRGRRQRQRYLELKEELKRRAVVEKAARDRAKVKAQKEEQERTSRAVAGVNHLEIPAELAFIFSKLDDWEQVHTERNLVKVVGNVTTMPRKYQLPHDIDYHAFTKFTNIYFKSHVWGMKREPIKTPFLAKAKDIDYQDSLAIFKLILRFMNDNNLSGKKETVLGDYIVNKGLANEKLRDEILCQLCNQTWNNANDANNERGWLLMANCLSVFPPSGTLYKYLLKYVSDHAYDGYKALCQKKLLEIDSLELPLARSYPPNLLEWRSNRKRVNMALLVHFSDGESATLNADSWTTSEELAGFAVRDKGVQDWKGWSIALSFDQGLTKETTGCDYVMDLISEMEVAPAFPVCKNSSLLSQDFVAAKSGVNEDVEVPLITPRRPINPPPQPPARKQSHELLEETIHAPRKPLDRMRSQSKDHTMDTGLSRKSALNDRYFEDGRSRSLDNLLESELTIPRKLNDLGLSRSRLNDRYHSVDKITSASSIIESRGVSNQEYMTKAEILLEENLESVSQRGENHRAAELNGSTAGLNDNQSDVAASSSNVNIDFDYQDIAARSEDDKGSYIKGHPRFIKSQYAGKRAAPGSHSSRAYIEKSDYTTKSSALSDTSEAPSLASHVRRVRVPSQASDVDQFLDDLFMPVLDGNLDELSDARSLAASIKGGGNERKRKESIDYDDDDYEVATLTNSAESHRASRGNAENVEDYITDLFQPIFVNDSLNRLTSATTLAQTIKGGGRGVQNQTTSQPGFTPIANMTSPPPVIPGMMSPTSMMMPLFTPTAQSSASLSFLGPGGLTGTAQSMSTGNFYSASPDSMMQSAMLHSIPIYNMQGLNIPNQQVDSNLLAYQQNLQRAFLQSAMAQNIQIQQQLFAQNQALQQLLQQQTGTSLSSHQQTPTSFGAENSDYWLGDKGSQSPAPPLPPKSKAFNSSIQTTTKAQIHRAPSPTQNKDRRYSFNKNGSQQTTAFTTVLTELKSRKSSQESVTSKSQGIPAPPPLPPPPDSRDPHNRSFIDSYGRAKTVRIGKWRWPPPQDENQEGSDSFLQFKLRQQRKTTPQKQSPQDTMEERVEGIEWDEFDMDNADKASTGNRKLSAPVRKESKDHKNSFKAFEVGAQRPTPGSIGKLRISSEMRHKLEMVTANHSVRSTTKSEKPSLSQVPNMSGPKKLEDNRRLLLEQQLAGRWGSVDSIDQIARAMAKDERADLQPTNIVRSQIERMEKTSPPAQSKAQANSWRPNPPPAPVAPPALDGMQNGPQVPSRSNSFYSTSHTPVARPRSPPPPIQPVKRNAFGGSDMFGNMRKESFGHHDFSHRSGSRRDDIFDDRIDRKDSFSNARSRESMRTSDFVNGTSAYKRKMEMDRRSSIADNMERIEIEESSEFLQPVDVPPPPTPIQRQQEVAETKLHPQPNAAHFTYNRVPWKLQVRKEVFSPVEKLTNPMAVHLIFCQIVRDVLAASCIRISREQRASMKKLLDGYGITMGTVASQNIKQTVKKNIVELAKEWGTYFCRLYPVSGGQTNRIVQYLGVSHSGIRLIRREKSVTSDYLQILETVTFDEIAEASVPKSSAVEIVLRTGGRLVLYSHRASQIQAMITRYVVESEKGGLEYVRGVSDHIHRDPSVLSFRKGEVIKILPTDHYVEKGWLYGVAGDRRGTFPCELVEPVSREELINTQSMKRDTLRDHNADNARGVSNKYKKILRLFGGSQKENEKISTRGSPPEKKSKKVVERKVGSFSGSRYRRESISKSMRDSWLELPDTLKRKKERISEEILSEYDSGDGSGSERREIAEAPSGVGGEKRPFKLGLSNFRSYMLMLHYSDGFEEGREHFGKRLDEGFGIPAAEDENGSPPAAGEGKENGKIGCESMMIAESVGGHGIADKSRKGKQRGRRESDENRGESGKGSESKKAKPSRESSALHKAFSSALNAHSNGEAGSVRASGDAADPEEESRPNNSGPDVNERGNSAGAEALYAISNKGFARNYQKPRIRSSQFRKPGGSSIIRAESEQLENPRTEEAAAAEKDAKGTGESHCEDGKETGVKSLPGTATGAVSNPVGLFVNEDFEHCTSPRYPLSARAKNIAPGEDETADPIRATKKGEPDRSNEADGEGKALNFKHYSEEEKAKKKSAEAIAKELSTQVFNRRHEDSGKHGGCRSGETSAENPEDKPTSEERAARKAPAGNREEPEDRSGSEMAHSAVSDHVRALEQGAARAGRPTGMETIAEETNSDLSDKLTIHEILHRFEELGNRREAIAARAEEKKATDREIQQNLKCLEEELKSFGSRKGKKYQQTAENVRILDKTSGGWTGKGPVNRAIQSGGRTGDNDEEGAPAAVHDGKHSLLQFAIHHFRQSPEKFEMLKTSDGSISGSLKVIEGKSKKGKEKGKVAAKDPSEWTWKEQVDLVKFTAKPIEQSLLRLDTTELNDLAVECFVCLMRYMGDLPMPTDVSEVKCVYTILMHCHRFEQLRDEVYCQLMKQTTNNKSVQQESCQRGWRLFSIVAAYFLCSDTLKPFLFKYLETAAYDKRRAYHGTATVCLQNLRKTFKYGGRKNVPSVEEITAISAGRNSKRQIYRLPGGTEKVVNTKSTTVVQDVIEELCIMINVTNPQEMEEFSVYCIVEGDTFTMPLAREEYILDVTTELQKNHQVFCLIFCRSVWSYPLRLDSQLYVEVVFNQIAPDYLEGLLLVMPGESLEQEFIYDIAKIAALLHRAADMTHVPTMKETKFLLPKPALSVRDVKPSQWVNMVQSNWQECENMTTIQAKAQFLDVLSKWPLFGSSFFAVKKASEPKERMDQILALNRNGVHFIDLATHETLLQYPFSEVISTRKVKSEDGTLFLDMKCGNLMQQRITRLQTDQAHEISRLIRQYITIQQITNVNHMQ